MSPELLVAWVSGEASGPNVKSTLDAAAARVVGLLEGRVDTTLLVNGEPVSLERSAAPRARADAWRRLPPPADIPDRIVRAAEAAEATRLVLIGDGNEFGELLAIAERLEGQFQRVFAIGVDPSPTGRPLVPRATAAISDAVPTWRSLPQGTLDARLSEALSADKVPWSSTLA
ncbi:MAG: hypothetical protein HYV07_17155 [Deltaproteobacteria bacterium]|nr:hypothetical protein [Deltaproteobacteria bacterium]